jgi:hypothetical protein
MGWREQYWQYLIVMLVSVSILDGKEQQDMRTATSPSTSAEPLVGQVSTKDLPAGCGKSDIILTSTKT